MKDIIETWITHYDNLAGSWNGSDDKFAHEGTIYTDTQAEQAVEIVEALKNVKNLIEEFNF